MHSFFGAAVGEGGGCDPFAAYRAVRRIYRVAVLALYSCIFTPTDEIKPRLTSFACRVVRLVVLQKRRGRVSG